MPASHHPTPFAFTPTYHQKSYPHIAPSQFSLSARSVLVTGASKGIGRAAAVSYARAGCTHIALGARSSLEETAEAVQAAAQEAGLSSPTLLALKLDVTDEGSVKAAAERVATAFGGELDVIVNNAGALEPWRPLGESEVDVWWRSWEVNVKGAYLMTRAILPLLLAKGDRGLRTVVQVSSSGALMVAPGASAYQGSKLALVRMGESLCADYAAQGLLAFSVHPGSVATELARGIPAEYQKHLTDDSALAGDALVWLTAQRREWLAGRYVSANWDFAELEEMRERIVDENLLKVNLDLGV